MVKTHRRKHVRRKRTRKHKGGGRARSRSRSRSRSSSSSGRITTSNLIKIYIKNNNGVSKEYYVDPFSDAIYDEKHKLTKKLFDSDNYDLNLEEEYTADVMI
jgi:hypothetical protein